MADCVTNIVWKRIPDINGDKLPDWKKYDTCSPSEVEIYLQNSKEDSRIYLEPSRHFPGRYVTTHGCSVTIPQGRRFSVGDVVSFFTGIQNTCEIADFWFDLNMPTGSLLQSGVMVWAPKHTPLSFDDIKVEYSRARIEGYSQFEATRLAGFMKKKYAADIKSFQKARTPDLEKKLETAIFNITFLAPYIKQVRGSIADSLLGEFRLRGEYFRELIP